VAIARAGQPASCGDDDPHRIGDQTGTGAVVVRTDEEVVEDAVEGADAVDDVEGSMAVPAAPLSVALRTAMTTIMASMTTRIPTSTQNSVR
jgi:hypothetical protein